MKDLYKVLEISNDAEKSAIKRAYFGLVRKFPPDRFPEEFKRIREAYEVLIDENTRKDYDAFNSMPEILKVFYDGAKAAFDEGHYEIAINILERAVKVYSNYSILQSLLGDTYIANENNVKAINIFEKLTQKEPKNAGFAAKLANAYLLRGWYKKAYTKYKIALALDRDNISIWLGLIHCYVRAENIEQAINIAEEAILTSKESGWDPIEIYLNIIQLDIMNNQINSVKKHVDELTDLVMENQENKDNTAWFLTKLANMISSNYVEGSLHLIEAAAKLMPDDKEIAKIKDRIFNDSKIIILLEKVRHDPKINNLIGAMIDFELHICDDENCIDCRFEQFSFEMDFLQDIGALRTDLIVLKNNYPELYEIKKEFFDKALDVKKERNLINEYYKRLNKYNKKYPEFIQSKRSNEPIGFFDDLDEYYTEPYVREEAKVGSNDPCPCGSGRKYKKCCGGNR